MSETQRRYQQHSVARKREVVEASMRPGASVAALARDYGINANQVWAWRKLYSEGRLDTAASASAVVAVDIVAMPDPEPVAPAASGSLEITIGPSRLCVTGSIDPLLLRTAIAALRA